VARRDDPEVQFHWLLEELCVKLGFCLPSGAAPRLRALLPHDPEGFTDAAFVAEGMDPDPLLHTELRQQVRDTVDKHLRRAIRCPLNGVAIAKLRDGRPAGPPPRPDPGQHVVDRVVGIQGTIQVTGQKVRVGRVHARKVVHVQFEETTQTIYDGQAAIATVPRHSTTEVNRFRAKHQIRTSSEGGAP